MNPGEEEPGPREFDQKLPLFGSLPRIATAEQAWELCLRTLRRRPIDRFEAAVTLEAHHGFPAATALALGTAFADSGSIAAAPLDGEKSREISASGSAKQARQKGLLTSWPGTERPGTERPGTERPNIERPEVGHTKLELSDVEPTKVGLDVGVKVGLDAGREPHDLTVDQGDEANRSDVTGEAERGLRRKRLFGEVVFIVSVLMVGFWVSSMASTLGIGPVDHAWRIALPVSLGAQWFLRRRYLSGEEGLGRLRREPLVAVGVLLLVGIVGFVGVRGPGKWIGAVLALLWSAGFLIARRGWWLQQFVILILTINVQRLLDNPKPLMLGFAAIAIVFALVAVISSPGTDRNASPWHGGVLAAGVGAGLGTLLVVEPEFIWSVRVPLPILTVLPSLLGSVWGAAHVSSLWKILPDHLRATNLSPTSGSAAGGAVRRLVLTAVLRVVILTAIGSAMVLWWANRGIHHGHVTDRLLSAHAVLAVAGLCVSLLEGFGRAGLALFCVLCGLIAALAGPSSFGPALNIASIQPGTRLLVAAGVTMGTSLIFLLVQIRDPARSIAAGI